MIYTSYFANIHNLPFKDCIAICHWKPGYFKGPHYRLVAPTEQMVLEYKAGKQDQEAKDKYIKAYQKVLDSLDPEIVGKTLQNKILLCYERPGDFCHRHLLAEWLTKHGFPCQEWDTAKQPIQESLF